MIRSISLGAFGPNALILLPSGALGMAPSESWVWVGAATGAKLRPSGRLRGARLMRAAWRRPRVRGNVKNPNDHPHGGTARSIRQARTPWGRLAGAPLGRPSLAPRALRH